MINLYIEDYCQKCNEFDVDVSEFTSGTIRETKEFALSCKHKHKCERIYKNLKEYIKEERGYF